MQGVLLAAGKGKRLQPLTLERSKAMAPVAGKPLAGRVAELLIAQGIDELIIVVGPNDEEVQPYFTVQANLGVPLRFVVQHERKGMAHALGLAAPLLRGDFIMSACDNLVSVEHITELVALQRRYVAPAVLSLMPIDIRDAGKTGVVVWEPPFVRQIVEKPKPEEAPSNISSLPLYVFGPQILDLLPKVQPSERGEYELQDAIQLLIEQTGRVLGVVTDSRQQVTDAKDLLALNLRYLEQESHQAISASALPADVQLVAPVAIESGVEIGPGCVIGPRVYIEAGARIGAGATLRETLVLRGSQVPEGETLAGEVVLPLTNAAPKIS